MILERMICFSCYTPCSIYFRMVVYCWEGPKQDRDLERSQHSCLFSGVLEPGVGYRLIPRPHHARTSTMRSVEAFISPKMPSHEAFGACGCLEFIRFLPHPETKLQASHRLRNQLLES